MNHDIPRPYCKTWTSKKNVFHKKMYSYFTVSSVVTPTTARALNLGRRARTVRGDESRRDAPGPVKGRRSLGRRR